MAKRIQAMPTIPSCLYGKVDGKIIPWNWAKSTVLRTEACAKELGLKVKPEPWLHTAIMTVAPVAQLVKTRPFNKKELERAKNATPPIDPKYLTKTVIGFDKLVLAALVTFVWDTREVVDIQYVTGKDAMELGQANQGTGVPNKLSKLQRAKDNGQPLKADVKAIIDKMLSKIKPEWMKAGYGDKD